MTSSPFRPTTGFCTYLLICLICALPAAADWPPPVPADWTLTVRETAGVARSGEIVRTGVPVPRSLSLTDASTLTVVDAAGTPVAAEILVSARWHASKTASMAPIQWLLVSFPATVAANQSATFRIVRDGSAGASPPPAVPLQVSQSGSQVTVQTGAASFVLGASQSALLDSAAPAGGGAVITGSSLELRVDNADTSHPTTRSVAVEQQGPLYAVVRIDGVYGAATVGGGGVAGSRRYVFRAGSPTVEVQQTVAWEGDRCGFGELACGGSPNARLVERWRDQLDVDLGAGSQTVAVVADRATGSAMAARTVGQEAFVRQLRRSTRQDPLVFERQLPGVSTVVGSIADGASLTWSGTSGAVAVAIERMHRFEPQALRVTTADQLAIDLADDGFWLGSRQGAFARFAIGVWSSDPGAATVERQVWAQLNHPLEAWA